MSEIQDARDRSQCDAAWSTPPGFTTQYPTFTRPHQGHECKLREDHGGDHPCTCGDIWTWAESVGMSS